MIQDLESVGFINPHKITVGNRSYTIVRADTQMSNLGRLSNIIYGDVSKDKIEKISSLIQTEGLDLSKECTNFIIGNEDNSRNVLVIGDWLLTEGKSLMIVNHDELLSVLGSDIEFKFPSNVNNLISLPKEPSELFGSLIDRLNGLVSRVKKRDGQFREFLSWASENTDYFIAPASPKYHLSRKHGLLEHSINVAETALKLRETLAPDLDPESIVITALAHDFGKAGNPNQPYYLERQATDKQIQYGYSAFPPYEYNKELQPYLPVPVRSVYWLSKFLDLSQEEFQAIIIHDGQYVDDNKSYALKETKLARLLQMADNWSGMEIEKGTEAVQTKNGKPI